MTAIDEALTQLRRHDAAGRAGVRENQALTAGLDGTDVRFAAVGGPLEARWDQALRELAQCISPFASDSPTLSEGGVYHGAWIESTGTISTEVLSRFAPAVAKATQRLYATQQRHDGLMPYKVTASGPAYSQIQLVSPLARAVRVHDGHAGGDRDHVTEMYGALSRMESWLAAHRDTRDTGGVEAFCTFDTGHDLSPRFWNVPERCFRGDAARWDPDVPALPFIAPDLTAHAVAQRRELGAMAAQLGEDPEPWRTSAAHAERSLWRHCWDEDAGMFYDRDAQGASVQVDSDVLLRVLACGIGDDAFFRTALERHLMSTRRFLSGYGLTSIAMDDPRFDHDYTRNSWAGPTNMLTAIRAPQAFEPHGRFAELALIERPLLEALAAAERFPQCLDPWTGTAGFTEVYSPAILWFLDALERNAGVMARPDGDVWLTALAPTRIGHGVAPQATAHGRTVRTGSAGAVRYEIANDDDHAEVWRDGSPWLSFPRGWRVVLDSRGELTAVVGLAGAAGPGVLTADAMEIQLEVMPNDHVDLAGGRPGEVRRIGMVTPRH